MAHRLRRYHQTIFVATSRGGQCLRMSESQQLKTIENYNLPNDNQSSGTLGDNGETERETTPNLVCNCFITQQTQNTCMTFVQRRPNVFDVGPALYTCYTNVLRLQVNCRSPNKITVVIINCLKVHIRHSSNCQFSPHSNLPTLSLVAVRPKSHYNFFL